MNGLLRKELLLLKSSGKTYIFLILFYAVFSLFSNSTMFSALATLILVLLPLTSFSLDELARWDKFAAALPGGRRAVVKSKYQFLFLTLAGALVLSFLVGVLVYFFGQDQSTTLAELVVTALICAVMGLLINCLLYPFLFKYGAQKARLYLALGIGIAMALIAVVIFLFRLNNAPLEMLQELPLAAIAAALIVLLAAAVVISYRISCRIYDNKEF